MVANTLKEELEFFNMNRSDWLKHYANQFALVHGRELVGVFTTFPEAYSEGIKRFGNVPMLIRQVLPTDPVQQAPALVHGLIKMNAQ